MGLIRILTICVICFLYASEGLAQPITTGNTKIKTLASKEDFEKAKRNMRPPKRKRIHYLYTDSSKDLLLGNPCAMKATREMGFEYVLQPLWLPGSPKEKQWEANNLMVNMKLFFTHGPFWRLILKRKIKNCQIQSGDIVG